MTKEQRRAAADLFWTTLWFFLFFAWIWLLIMIFGDIFRSRDLSGWGKALWTIFVVFVPWLGVLVYLIVRGGSMAERHMQQAAEREQATQQYIQSVASEEHCVHSRRAQQARAVAGLRRSHTRRVRGAEEPGSSLRRSAAASRVRGTGHASWTCRGAPSALP